MRKIFSNLLLIIVSLAISALGLEIALRFFDPLPNPYSMPQGYMGVDGNTWRLTPNFQGIMDNKVDFRNKILSTDERGIRKTPASSVLTKVDKTLFVLGDSQTAGVGLSDNETWSNCLQEIIIKNSIAVKVENWGVPAINIDQYEARLPKLLKQAKPGDVVLVGISWNDLTTPLNVGRQMEMVEGYLVSVPTNSDDENKWKLDAAKKIHEYTTRGNKLPDYQNLKDFFKSMAEDSAFMSFIYNRLRNIYLMHRDDHPILDAIRAETHTANLLLLRSMKEKAEEVGVEFAIILLPDAVIFNDAIFTVFSQNKRFFSEQDVMRSLTKKSCQENKIICLNAFNILNKHQNEGLSFVKDGHYNALGAKYIADYLYSNLEPMLKNKH